MKRYLKQALSGTLILVALFVAVLLVRAMAFTSMQIAVEPQPLPAVNIERAAETLAQAIRFQTFSFQEPEKVDPGVFEALHAMLEERFPRVHEHLEKEKISGLSLLYRWRGSASGQKALLLLAHQDVVPAPDADIWEHGPFSGAITEGYIWGRGAMDDKGSMIGILEAVETLLEQGFQPNRDIYLCFGHDEEVGGWHGAAAMAARLKERGVQAEFSLDEGMAILSGDILGLDQPIAFISTTEKGYLSLELKVEGDPGHSSTPPRETTIGILAESVARVAQNQMPARMTEPVRHMFRYLGPEMDFFMRIILANQWLTEPVLLRQLAGAPTTDAAIRTTTAVTIIEGGETENVLPATARAVVNFRLLPGDTIASMTERTRTLVNDDRVAIAPTCTPNESPSPSRVDAPGFRAIQETVGHVFPDAVVAPTMVLGGTDSHHYAIVAENIYGFMPLRMSEEDLKRIHGPNERISIEDFKHMIAFYMMLIESAARQVRNGVA